jgi:taurine---2-oxoglutarate transaminase
MKSINGKLSKKGFMTYTHENMIIIAPPLIITAEQITEELQKVDEVLTEVDAEI